MIFTVLVTLTGAEAQTKPDVKSMSSGQALCHMFESPSQSWHMNVS